MAQQAWMGEATGSADDETKISAADSNQEPQPPRTVDGSVSANDANELATIRVRTMYGLVEDIPMGGHAPDARILYLTNMQARLFGAETVPKMLNVFEVSQASLVINLMDSGGYPVEYATDVGSETAVGSEQDDVGLENDYECPHNVFHPQLDSFASRSEATQATRRLSKFFKEVLLPLAAETNAVILCNACNGDILAATLTEVLPTFAAQFGGKIPFTVFGMLGALEVAWSTLEAPSTFAYEMAAKSKNWRHGFAKIEAAAVKDQGSNRSHWFRTDVLPGLENYIAIESVSGVSSDQWQADRGPLQVFQNELLQSLASELPTLCVRTGGSNQTTPLTANVELAGRDIPVLMLDPQSRPPLDVSIDPANPAGSTRDELVAAAITGNIVRHEELWALGRVQSFDQHDLAFFFGVLNGDGSGATTLAGDSGSGETQTLYESLKVAEQLKAMDETRNFTQLQLERVIDHLVEMMAQSHFRALPVSQQQELQKQDGFTPADHWTKKMETIWGVYYDLFKSHRIYGASLADLDHVKNMIDQIVKRDRLPPSNSLEAQQALRDAWNSIDVCVYNANWYKLLGKTTYVLCLMLGLLVIVFTVFKSSIDGEATLIACTNDSAVDTCEAVVTSEGSVAATAIFVTASVLTLVSGVENFYDPSRRWRELRAVAETLKSEIFSFRTRTGAYTIDRVQPRKPEQLFVRRVQDARVVVVQLGGLTESSFMRKYNDNVYIHGQNESSRLDAFDVRKLSQDIPIHLEIQETSDGHIIDNHHSPMKPKQYVAARLIPTVDYYQNRVPRKYREHKVTMFLSLLATSSIAVLSHLSGTSVNGGTSDIDFTAIAAVVSGFVAAVTAWRSESGANRKMSRYTNAVTALKNHLVWWNSLTPVDQASQANIDILVSVTEQIKLAEVSAWADASRRKEEGEGTGVSDDSVTVGEQNSRPTNKNVVHPEP